MATRPLLLFVASVVACAGPNKSVAYELATHGHITYKAFIRSRIADSDFVQTMGIRNGADPFGTVYYDTSGTAIQERIRHLFEQDRGRMPTEVRPLSIEGWLLRGAIREDDAPGEPNPQDDPFHADLQRPVHHFYDPVFNRPLTVTGLSKLDADVHRAPDWAIGGRDIFGQPNTSESNRRNHFTAFDAREAMYRALTGRDSQGNPVQPAPTSTLTSQLHIRNAYWATTFRSIGDVLHLNQDMAQPQHTRNDPHSGKGPLIIQEVLTGHTSVYEKYIDARATREPTYRIDGLAIVPAELIYDDGYVIPNFSKYSDFWSTREGALGRGLADYSNRGFFTDGTNLGSNPYVAPSNDSGSFAKLEAVGVIGSKPDARVNFLLGDIPDYQDPGSTVIRITTESAYDAFLEARPPVYSLNRFNYDDMAKLLIPRAVAYSAGLINYFFRGKIDLVSNPDSPGQYLIKNLGQEPMKGKFRLYYDDATDTRHPVRDAGGNEIVWDTEVLLASASGMLAPGANMPVAGFEPPANPAPKTSAEYMLVFSGDMGEERADPASGNVGAVVGKLISAPYNGVLYFAGVNTQKQMEFFKLDRNGISALGANEPNPFHAIPSQPFGQYNVKQTVITRSPDGAVSHKTVGVIPRVSTTSQDWSLVTNLTTGALQWKSGLRWTARSPDPAIGAFEFTLNLLDQAGFRAIVTFVRHFSDANGQPAQATGAMQMPDANVVRGAFQYSLIRIGAVLISGDGTMLYQRSVGSSSLDNPLSALKITLSASPSVTVVPLAHGASTNTNLPFVNTQIQTGFCTVAYLPDRGAVQPVTATSPAIRSEGSSGSESIIDTVSLHNLVLDTPVLASVRTTTRRESRVMTDQCYVQGYDWSDGSRRIKMNLQVSSASTRIDRFERASLLGSGSMMYVEDKIRIRPVTVHFSCGFGENASLQASTVPSPISPVNYSVNYEGFCPPSNVETTGYFQEEDRDNPKKMFARVLTANIEDAVYNELEFNPDPVWVTKFRNKVLPTAGFIAETSPLGEVLVMTGDFSIIEHHPLAGKMPKLTRDMLPPGIVGIAAAIWM